MQDIDVLARIFLIRYQVKMYKLKCGFLEIFHSLPLVETERIYHIPPHISIGFTAEFIRLLTPLTCLDGLCYMLIF